MTSPDSTWLAERTPAAPRALLARMQQALAGSPHAADRATRLGNAALACLREALPKGRDRSAALPLLAADALLTYACEAAAEEGIDALSRVCTSYDAQRMAELLGTPAS
jgi:hypothetical protein